MMLQDQWHQHQNTVYNLRMCTSLPLTVKYYNDQYTAWPENQHSDQHAVWSA